MGFWRREEPKVCPPSHEQFGPIAEEVQQRIIEYARHPYKNPEDVLATVMQELTREGAAKLIVKSWREMPPVERMKILAEFFPGEVVQTALQAEYERLAIKADPRKRLAGIIAQAREAERLDLDDLEPGAKLVLYLYRKPYFTEASSLADVPGRYYPDRVIRLEAVGGGEFRVLGDMIDPEHRGGYNDLEHHQIIELGSYLPAEEDLDHVLYVGSEARYRYDGDVSDFDVYAQRSGIFQLWLGRCTLNGQEVFFDLAEPRTDVSGDQ